MVLALGLGAAAAVYWLGTRSADLNDDLSMQGFDRAERRQMGMVYGNMGLLIQNFLDGLKQPGDQALLIVAVSVVVAAGCFYFARLAGEDDQPG